MVKLKFRLVDFYRHTNVQEKYNFLQNSQWWEKNQLLEYQLSKLKNLIDHSYQNVPYYRALFDNIQLKPQDIEKIEDIKDIPFLTKDIIKNNFEKLIAKNATKFGLWPKSTGGSTGTPLQYYLSYEALTSDVANRLRAWSQAGYKLGDKVIYFGGASLMGNLDLKRKIYFKLYNFVPISSFQLNDKSLFNLIKTIKKSDVEIMFSYASSAAILADYILKNKIDDIHLRAIFTTAEVLFPEMREKISRAMNCEVYNSYGANDGGITAFECELHNGLHIASERTIVEVVNDEGNIINTAEEGNVVSTDLTNYSMPFIRYRVNDVISLDSKPCLCGRELPLIKNIKGRTSDFILDKDNTKVHGEFFSHIFGEYNWIEQFQVIQEDREHLNIILKSEVREEKKILQIKKFLEEKFSGIKIIIKFVDNIEKTKNDKHKFIISKIVNEHSI